MAASPNQPEVVINELLSLLRVDGNGWNIALFEDTSKASTCICDFCGSICCDAVELGCEHDDDEICLFCNQCLTQLITDNTDKCIINNHNKPSVVAARSARRQIFRSIVICPFSAQFKTRCTKHSQNDNKNKRQLLDTMGNDNKKEGNPNIITGCEWKGTLKQLINEHISDCVKIYNPTYSLKIKIQKLEENNRYLNEKNISLQAVIDDLIQLNQQKSKNENKLKGEILSFIHGRDAEITQMKLRETRSDQNIIELQLQIQQLQKTQVEELKSNYDNDFEFHISDDCKSLFKKMSKNVLLFAGKFNTFCWCRYGNVLSGNDKAMVYFEMDNAGNASNYGFGFVTPQQKAYSCKWQHYGIQIDGRGCSIRPPFNDIFAAPIEQQQLTSAQITIIDTKKSKNVVVMSVDMSERKGWIWNEDEQDTGNIIEFNLPRYVSIEVMLAGTGKKFIVATNVLS